MHVAILLLAVLGAGLTRHCCVDAIARLQAQSQARSEGRSRSQRWNERWSLGIVAMVMPALWLAIALVAVGSMDTHGTMFGYGVSAIGRWISGGAALGIVALLSLLLWRSRQLQRELRHYPTTIVAAPPLHSACPTTLKARAITSPAWFAGQVGCIQPELALGRSLLTELTAEQLSAIVAHECAHAHYRDTLLFFVLGWLRRWTGWLPHTQRLWQELLVLRELRADRWAAQFVDPLVLAETLVVVAQSAANAPASSLSLRTQAAIAVGFHDFTTADSFEARIEALIAQDATPETTLCPPDGFLNAGGWLWAVLACFPLLAVPFHHLQ